MSRFARIRSASTTMPSAMARVCSSAPWVSTKACGITSASACQGPVARSWSCAIAPIITGTSPCTVRAAARMYSDAIGLRFCGMVEDWPRPAT